MSLWKRLQDRVVQHRLDDEAYHAKALAEINQGMRRDGLWAKALAKTGNSETAKAEYLRLLVVALKDQDYIAARTGASHPVQPQVAIAHSPLPSLPERGGALGRRLLFALLFVVSITIIAFTLVIVLTGDKQAWSIWHWLITVGWLWLWLRASRRAFREVRNTSAA